jgi:hypothetical protein
MATSFSALNKVRLVDRFVGTDDLGIMFDLEPGMEGVVRESAEGTTMVEFANYTQVFEIPNAILISISDSGHLPPHALWPTNESLVRTVNSPSAKIKEMILAPVLPASETAGRERLGDVYFIEDVRESQKAYTELAALAQSLASTRQSSTTAVASLIREATHRFSPAHHKEIRRDLNGLLGDVLSPTIEISTEQVIGQVEGMMNRILTGSKTLPAHPNELTSA